MFVQNGFYGRLLFRNCFTIKVKCTVEQFSDQDKLIRHLFYMEFDRHGRITEFSEIFLRKAENLGNFSCP